MHTKKHAQFYDYWHTQTDKQEYLFFQRLIAQSNNTLELGCGTGRLLLPLIKEGYAVDGVDSSPDMLAICQCKAGEQDLNPILFQQKIQKLSLPKKYDLIFSALETFGHIANRDDALKALHAIYDHLQPDGMLAVYLSLPWLYAPENSIEWRKINQVTINNDEHYTLYEKSIHDPLEQLFYHFYRIQKNGTIINEYETPIRWYSRYEFSDMLASVGFKNIHACSGYTGDGPLDVMIFTAQR